MAQLSVKRRLEFMHREGGMRDGPGTEDSSDTHLQQRTVRPGMVKHLAQGHGTRSRTKNPVFQPPVQCL